MIDRIVELADSVAHLSVRNAQLIIDPKDYDPVSLPLCDLAALVIAHPQVTLTQAVLAGAAEAGAAVIVCNEKRLPTAMLLPIDANYVQTERFAKQAQAPLPLRKQLWSQIVRAKIEAQARTLVAFRGEDFGLPALARIVRSGDSQNVEARASRRYWPALFGDPDFRRRREAEDQNRNLNYGYAVLRAIVARAICAAGLHPSLGMQHHNRYNPFCLADDLMEPFRPLVDYAVAAWVAEHGPRAEFGRQARAHLLTAITGRFRADGEIRTLFDIASRCASSLARVLLGEGKRLDLPPACESVSGAAPPPVRRPPHSAASLAVRGGEDEEQWEEAEALN